MSVENAHDPRTTLVRTKYFSLHPKPLERWLWQQGLPQAAERVFWLHWEEGMRSGDWCSEIPIKRVARECCVDPSTVTRAYQLLKAQGLIRREDPGRDPHNPFQQAIAITEVRLPRELLTELSRSPNRLSVARVPMPVGTTVSAAAAAAAPVALKAPAPAKVPAQPLKPLAGHPASASAIDGGTPTTSPSRPTRQQTQAMWDRASAAEHARYFAASRDRQTAFACDPGTRLTDADRIQILALLAQQAAATPDKTPPKAQGAPKPATVGPRRLTILELARVRRQVVEIIPGDPAREILRQVVWSVEEGALVRFPLALAINIALKKIREGAWSKPNRLPPNWLPRSATPARAGSEHCVGA
jgi:hypothetical protein